MISVIVAGCLVGVLLHWSRSRDQLPETRQPEAAGLDREARPQSLADSAAKSKPVQSGDRTAVGSQQVEGSEESISVAEPEPSKVVNPSTFWKMETPMLGVYLRDADPAAVARYLETLNGRDQDNALQALRKVLDDTTSLGRLEALQLLVNWSKLNAETLTGVLDTALRDPNPAFANIAVGTLAGRSDEQATTVLAKLFREGDTPTRLLVVESIPKDGRAAPLLNEAVSDADETIRKTAVATLFPPSDEELLASQQKTVTNN